jgi:NADPH:quinone reductase-like Zn-dependent oxidoreductase
VHAAGINFSDLLARQGLYLDAPRPPVVMGYEVAGVVDAVGDGVDTPRLGDRVMALARFGGQAEQVVVSARTALPLPSDWTLEQGAAFPVVYLTAHHMLVYVGAARPGETVLVHAAAGGVGLAVAELGKILGLRIIGLASPGKHDVLRTYGVEPIDGRAANWAEAARAHAPHGFDIVLNGVGGASWRAGYRMLAPAGRLICYGASEISVGLRRNPLAVIWKAIRWPRFGVLHLMNSNRAVAGVNLGHLWSLERILMPQLEALLRYTALGQIRPRVDRSFPLDEAAAAHRYIHERRNIGKVVLTF